MSDLINREDAIEAFGLSEKTRKYGGDHSGYDTMLKYEIQDVLESLPSAEAEQEAVPAVVRVTMSDGSQYYLEHERDAIQADAVQGEWAIRKNGNKECSLCGHERQDGWDYFCGYCGARMKGGDTE